MYGNNRNQQMRVYDPFREMENLQRSFFGDSFSNFFSPQSLSSFKTDITDEGDHYLLVSDLPGFDKQDITLQLNGDTLTIQAKREAKTDHSDEKVVRMERSYGVYSRQFNVSEIDTDNIRASYENGVLSLRLPKKSTTLPQSRMLEIE